MTRQIGVFRVKELGRLFTHHRRGRIAIAEILVESHRAAWCGIVQEIAFVVVDVAAGAVYRRAEVCLSVGIGMRTRTRDTYLDPFVVRRQYHVFAGVYGRAGCEENRRDECERIRVSDRD